MTKERVALFGASGTMGFQAFQELWRRRDRYDLAVLLRSGEAGLAKFQPYLKEAGLATAPRSGVVDGNGLRVVWGDAREEADVAAVVAGVDWVLNAMAVISPQADYYPELAQAVNDEAIGTILAAIEAEPDGPERIGYVHTGSVAQTGNRPVGVHVGRIGDPLNPSVFDAYAVTKIAGERRVLESSLKRWVSLRMSFIMPTDHARLMALLDPIAFHMPLATRMENITDRDAGFAMVNCLELRDEPRFWRRVYNLAGGPTMRTNAYQYLNDAYAVMGLEWERCSERNWYALRNFHLQYFEDSAEANGFLHHWRDDIESHQRSLESSMAWYLRLLRWLSSRVRPIRRLAEAITYRTLKRLSERHLNSPRHWYLTDNTLRLEAFFGGRAAYEAIPGWDEPILGLEPDAPYRRLDHGYDETKTELALSDLRSAAEYRGGSCLDREWSGDMHQQLSWLCAFGHRFTAKPNTVLHAGHWCPVCAARWNGAEQARLNPFFAQVWYADHAVGEKQDYPWDGIEDIRGADELWRRGGRNQRGGV